MISYEKHYVEKSKNKQEGDYTLALLQNGGHVMFIKQNNLKIRNASAEDAAILGKWWRDGKIMAHAGFPNWMQSAVKKRSLKEERCLT